MSPEEVVWPRRAGVRPSSDRTKPQLDEPIVQYMVNMKGFALTDALKIAYAQGHAIGLRQAFASAFGSRFSDMLFDAEGSLIVTVTGAVDTHDATVATSVLRDFEVKIPVLLVQVQLTTAHLAKLVNAVSAFMQSMPKTFPSEVAPDPLSESVTLTVSSDPTLDAGLAAMTKHFTGQPLNIRRLPGFAPRRV